MQFIDLAAQRERIGDRLHKAVADVLNDGRYILGPQVGEFESQLGEFLGVEHVIACANGTDALLVPLMASGIGPGDAVFVPSFTFSATAEVVALTGAVPVFVDVRADTYNIDPASLEQAIAGINAQGRLQPRAVIPVDLFGIPADYPALQTICRREGLVLLEDAAQAIGATTANGSCGSFGDVAAASFYPAKPLGCYGDGGAMLTDDSDLAGRLRSLAFHGRGESQYDNIRVGVNSRLDTLQAAILLEKLAIFSDELNARQQVAAYYSENLNDCVTVPHVPGGARSAWAQYAIRCDHRDGLKTHLQEQGIPSVIYYTKPLHRQVAYRDYPIGAGGLEVTDFLPHSILCLPMHPYLKRTDQDRIIETIRTFLATKISAIAAE